MAVPARTLYSPASGAAPGQKPHRWARGTSDCSSGDEMDAFGVSALPGRGRVADVGVLAKLGGQHALRMHKIGGCVRTVRLLMYVIMAYYHVHVRS